MGEASYEVLKRPLESDLPEQIEVRVRRERRRRWTAEDKLRIVQEAFGPNAVAKHVAERHEVSTGLLFTWRRQLMASGRSSLPQCGGVTSSCNRSSGLGVPRMVVLATWV